MKMGKRVLCIVVLLVLASGLRALPARANLSGSRVEFAPSAGGQTCFIPNRTGQTLCFRIETSTTDGEDVATLFMRFPSDWTVEPPTLLSATFDNGGYLDGDRSWTVVGDGYALYHKRVQNAPDHCVAYYSFPVNTGSVTTTDASVSWSFYSSGTDGSAPPHRPCSSDGYYGPVEGCDETTNPPATVPVCEHVLLDVQPEVLPAGYTHVAYTQQLSPYGADYTWWGGGDTPDDLHVTPSGALDWNPPAAGTYNFTVYVRGPGWSDGSRVYSLEIKDPLSCFAAPAFWLSGFRYFGPQNRNPRMTGDMNGDGKDDLVAFDPGVDRGTLVALSTGSAFAKPSLWSHDFNWQGDAYSPRVTGDVDGDGIDDVVGFRYEQGVYAALSTGSTLQPAALWLSGMKLWAPQNRYPRMLGDANGDGKDDAVAVNPSAGSEGAYVGLSDGTKFAKPTKWSSEFGWLGDNMEHRAMGDVNGDGKDDIVGYLDGDGVYVGLSSGSAFGAASEWLDGDQPWGPQGSYPWLLGDVDGDGQDDIVAFLPDEHIWVAFSTGSAFEELTMSNISISWLNDDPKNVLQLGDVDGANGVDLVIYRYNDGVYVCKSNAP